MVVALLAVASVLIIGHAVFVAAMLVARAGHRRDDAMLFTQCVSGSMRRTRRLLALIPGPPRCRICYLPFGGVGRVLRASPSRVNPNFCRVCFERLPDGSHPMDIGVLFADVRGFTTYAEQLPPEQLAVLSRRFLRVATDVLARHDAVIDGFMGDGVLALFLPALPTLSDRTCDTMLRAAAELVTALADSTGGPPLEIGAAVHYGPALVGNISGGVVKEFRAVGDVVTTASRLQQRARGGEILVSDTAWDRLSTRVASRHRVHALRGKATRVGAHRVEATTLAAG